MFLVEGALNTDATFHMCMEKYMPVLRVQWGKNPIFTFRQRKQGSEVEILPHGFSVCGFCVFLSFNMLAAFQVFGVSAWQCLSLNLNNFPMCGLKVLGALCWLVEGPFREAKKYLSAHP